MKAVKISESDAFSAGSDLWVLKNDPKNKWWQEIDFRSGFLLSHSLVHTKKTPATKLTEILQLTEMTRLEFVEETDFLLLGSSDHFLNKWILLCNQNQNQNQAQLFPYLGKTMQNLKTDSVRFFAEPETFLKTEEARQKASSLQITYIANA